MAAIFFDRVHFCTLRSTDRHYMLGQKQADPHLRYAAQVLLDHTREIDR